MAQVNFVFGDIYTGRIECEIPLYGASFVRGMGLGELRGSFQLDQTGKANTDLLAATQPGGKYVVCERDKQPVWGGLVWTRTYQSQAKVNQLYCRAFEHYPDRRLIREDLTYTGIDKRNIFIDLWRTMQDDPNSFQVELPSDFATEYPMDYEVLASEFKTYRSAMDEIANADDGFDWTIDTTRVEGVYIQTLRIGYPTLGAVDTYTVFDYPGSITNYWQNSSMASTGTHIYGVGGGEGGDMLLAEVIHEDLLDANFLRYDLDISMKGINNLDLLTNLTIQQARIRKAPGTVITAEVKADQAPVFGGYGLGDACKIFFKDPRYEAGFEFISRILGWEYYPPSDSSVEMARLVFEGEDL
jgi:hypothetical protein